MKSKPLPLFSVYSSFILSIATAQSAVWIADADTALWNTPSHWNSGIVPNTSESSATLRPPHGAQLWDIFLGRNLPYRYIKYGRKDGIGGALPVITGNIQLGELHFRLPDSGARQTALFIGAPDLSSTGILRIKGSGITISSTGTSQADLTVLPGSSLVLSHQAAIGSIDFSRLYIRLYGATGSPATLKLQHESHFNSTSKNPVTISGLGPTAVEFGGHTHAGNARFSLPANSKIAFYNHSSAAKATFNIDRYNLLLFAGQSTAAQSTIAFEAGPTVNNAIVRFAEQSSAAQSRILGHINHGAVEFTDQASGGNANIGPVLRLDISGAETGTGSTGRTRASTSTLQPSSVIADDARTISLNNIHVKDILLGSNTLEVNNGSIWNIRDSGGAYLSSNHENLIGGGIIKLGTGTLNLYGPTYNPADPDNPSYNVISGPSVVNEGTLILHNRLADVTVNPIGILSGSGIVDGDLLNQGTVRPQSSILAVTGNFIQETPGIFAPYFAYTPGQPTTYGLDIDGQAILEGTLSAATHPNMFTNWDPGVVELQILSATSIKGRFDHFDTSDNPARIKLEAIYAPTTVTLRFEMLPFEKLATTSSARSLGAYLDQVYQKSGRVYPNNYNWVGDSLTFATNEEEVAQTMNNLAPDRYGSLLEHALTSALARSSALQSAVGFENQTSDTHLMTWFAEGGQSRITYESVDGLPEAKSVTTNWLVGGYWRAHAWTIGAYIAPEKTNMALDTSGSTAKINSAEPGLFVGYHANNFFAQVHWGVSRDRYKLKRVVNHTNFNNYLVNHTAQTNGRRTDWHATMGYSFNKGDWSISPFIGGLTSCWRINDFTESTDSTFLRDHMFIDNWSHNSRRAQVGFEAATQFRHGRLRPHLIISWSREFENNRSIPTGLVGAPAGYLAPGRPADADIFQSEFGLDLRLSQYIVFTASSNWQFSALSHSTSDFKIGFRWIFQ